MRISWNWLRTLVDVEIDAQEAADILTSTGLEVESLERVEPIKGMLEGVIVGLVLKRVKHPDADRLSVCSVDIGAAEPSSIVCGAPNVAEGQKVLVATVGSTLHMADGTELTIRQAKIRGVVSAGMICAEDELGIGKGHEGILVVDPKAEVGTPAATLLDLEADTVFEIGLTPNRSDALGHFGVARDLAAAVKYRTGGRSTLILPDVSAYAQDDDARTIQVDVQAKAECARYAGVTLTNVSVGPSPAWLRERLKVIGLKPINNVVDVTNFVQHELGQPLHAFDADRITGDRILIQKLKNGSQFTTLDGVERQLSDEDLMICDPDGGLCIAGVFGGIASGVTATTQGVFLESAVFDPVSIRKTARRHGLNTDASFRFERGVDPEMTVIALKRAALLLKEICGARISSPVVDIISGAPNWTPVVLRFATLQRSTGSRIDQDDVVEILELLQCTISERNEDLVRVLVPPFRADVLREMDLVEEVLRIHGFDRVPLPERLMCPVPQKREITIDGMRQRLALHLASRGMHEVMTPSLVNAGSMQKLHGEVGYAPIHLKNPLSAELDVLRPSLLFGMLATASHNIARQQRDLRLFEQGRVYRAEGDGSKESERTAILMTGDRFRKRWSAHQRDVELTDLKAEVEMVLDRMGVLDQVSHVRRVHPVLNNAVALSLGKGRTVAVFGEVPKKVLHAFEVEQACFYAELMDEEVLAALQKKSVTYADVPRFPTVRRDLSLLLDNAVAFEDLKQSAFRSERKLLHEVDLFDVYEGDKIPDGKKSYALSFTLLDRGATLTDGQVDKAMARIQGAFEKEFGAQLRN